MSPLLAAAPALPLHTAGRYVAAAYVMFVAILLLYVAIMARRLRRMERELVELQTALDMPARDVGRSPAAHARPEVESPRQSAGPDAPRRHPS
jgi:hypothetical protein